MFLRPESVPKKLRVIPGRSTNGCQVKNFKFFQISNMVATHWDEKILKIWWLYLISLQSYIAILIPGLVSRGGKIEKKIKFQMSAIIEQITLSVLQITLTGLKLYQQNQRCQCSEDLLESYGIEKLPKSTNICQILQKSQFKQFLYWKVGSVLYVKCGWFCPQKHKTEHLSSIICDYTGFWKWDKLQKVRNYGSKTHFWSPISSE